MSNNAKMLAKDAIAGSQGECYITIGDRRYNFMQAINVEVNFEKTKTEVSILGKMGKGHKSTGWKGTGSATFHYNTSLFREIMENFKNTGEDIYFDMQITNEDRTSAAGRQTVILTGCNFDSGILAKFDAGSDDPLDEDMDFTFEDFKIPEKFNLLDGMI